MFDRNTDSKESDQSASGSRVDLTTTLYGELRKLAATRMAAEQNPQSLQATALVHEAWLRLGGENQPKWESRAHFFGAVAGAMRYILIDRARRRKRIRHGGGLIRVDMDVLNWEQMDPSLIADKDDAILLVHELLQQLAVSDPEVTRLVELHYFAGLSVIEAAEALELSERTAGRRLAYARAWLNREIRRHTAA